MKNTNKTVLMTAVAVAAVAMAPQMASARGKTTTKTTEITSSSSSHSSSSSSSDKRFQALEDEIKALKAEIAKNNATDKADAKAVSSKISAHEAAVEEKLAKQSKSSAGKNTLFFRGGFADMTHPRTDELLTGNAIAAGGALATVDPNYKRPDGQGWYIGAGLDHRLTDNLWGMSDLLAVDGEVMFEYKNFGATNNSLVAATNVLTTGGNTGYIKNQVTQFTLTASPKIKFNTGTAFTPWVIPFGLGIHVISPPSSGVTVLNPGVMVGTGAEYALWKSIVLGADFRYHFTGKDLNYTSSTGRLNKTDIDGLTAGGYLGFKF